MFMALVGAAVRFVSSICSLSCIVRLFDFVSASMLRCYVFALLTLMSCFKSDIGYGSYKPTPEVLALLKQVDIGNQKLTHEDEAKSVNVPFMEPNKELMADFMKRKFPIGRIRLSRVGRFSEQIIAAEGMPELFMADDSVIYYKGSKLMTPQIHYKMIKKVAELDKAELFYSGLSNCVILRLDDDRKLVVRINLDHAAFAFLPDGKGVFVQPFSDPLDPIDAFVVFFNDCISKLEIIGYMNLIKGVLPRIPTFVKSVCVVADIAAEGFSKEMRAVPFIGAFKLYLPKEIRFESALRVKGHYITNIDVSAEFEPRCRMMLDRHVCLNEKHKNPPKGVAEVDVLASIVTSCNINGENRSVDEETMTTLVGDEQSMELARIAGVVLLGNWRGIGPVDPIKKDDPEEFGKVDLEKIPGYRNIRNLPFIQEVVVPVDGSAAAGSPVTTVVGSGDFQTGTRREGPKVAEKGAGSSSDGVARKKEAITAEFGSSGRKKEVVAGTDGSSGRSGAQTAAVIGSSSGVGDVIKVGAVTRSALETGAGSLNAQVGRGRAVEKGAGGVRGGVSASVSGAVSSKVGSGIYSTYTIHDESTEAIKSRFAPIGSHAVVSKHQSSLRPFDRSGGILPGGYTPDMVEAAKKAVKEEKKRPDGFVNLGTSLPGIWGAFN